MTSSDVNNYNVIGSGGNADENEDFKPSQGWNPSHWEKIVELLIANKYYYKYYITYVLKIKTGFMQ